MNLSQTELNLTVKHTQKPLLYKKQVPINGKQIMPEH